MQEAATSASRINLPDDDPAELETLLHYLYCSEYCDSERPSSELASVFAVRIYAMADKYDVAELRGAAEEKLAEACDLMEDVNELVTTLETIEECTNPMDSALWEVVIPNIQDNITKLLAMGEFKEFILAQPTLYFRLLATLQNKNDDASKEDSAEGE